MFGRRLTALVAKVGVRPRLSIVALVAIAPLFGLLIAGAIKDRDLTLEAAKVRVMDLARVGSERQDDIFQHAKDVLTVLRSQPEIVADDRRGCQSRLQAVGSDYPQFTNIGVTDAAGNVTCSSLGGATMRPLGDADLFRAAMAADRSAIAVGRFRIGVFTGKPIVIAAIPLLPSTPNGVPPGIAYVSIDLDWSARHALDFPGSADATLSVIDARAATILVRSPDLRRSAGKVIAGGALMKALLASPGGGSVEAQDIDGTPEVFGFAPLDAGGSSGIMVAVGLERAAVLADADRRFMIGVGFSLLTMLIAVGAAWLLGDRTQFRAIRALVEAARKLGAGDLTARAEMSSWQAPEFRTLSDTLGDMASSISVAQASLTASERQLRLLAENSTDMILRVRHNGQRVYASPACRALLGWEPEEMLEITSGQAIHPDDRVVLAEPQAFSAGQVNTLTYRMRRKDGSYVWVESVSRPMPPEAGQPPERIVVVRDIEARVAAERRLKESEERYRLLAENGTDMVFELDLDLVRRYVSPACRELLGQEPEELVGTKPVDMVHRDDAEQVVQVCRSVLAGEVERASVTNRISHSDGRWIWVEANVKALRDSRTGAISGIIGALRDVSVRKAAEEQLEDANRRLEALAWEDALTALANRRTFDDVASKEYSRGLRDQTSLALIMIDVDRFKAFNDHYGHPAGDECLRQVSRAVKQVIRRPGDLAARYGGEEFAVLLPGTDEAGAALLADRIRAAIALLGIEHLGSAAKIVTVSAGVATISPVPGVGFDTLVRRADRALYMAKHRGRNAVVCASVTLVEPAEHRSTAA